MSIEIGYNYWENGKIVSCDDAWMNGRNEFGDAWGRWFRNERKDGVSITYAPVFNKEMDGVTIYGEDSDYKEIGRYVELNDFLGDMFGVIDTAEDEDNDIRINLIRANELDRKRIADLRAEQRKCTDEDAYAFRKWGEEIDELYESIAERQRALNDEAVLVEDYDSPRWRIDQMRKLLEGIQRDLKAGKTVVPFYSY